MMALREHAPGLALAELLDGFAVPGAVPDVRVTGIGLDSRTLRPGDLFCALPGTVTSGARFLAQAARAGAAAALVDAGEVGLPSTLPLCAIDDLRGNAGRIAARFFGDPTRRQQVIGVTGTNGKTSVTHFIASALDGRCDRQAAVIGTLGSGRVGELEPGKLTTPDPVELQRLFAVLLDRGIETVAMEVSSHALAQHRVGGVRFCCAVFTNLSRDHLDYHADMEAYGEAKRLLFEQPELGSAVINVDDAWGRGLHAALTARLRTVACGLDAHPHVAGEFVRGELEEATLGRLRLRVRSPWGAGRLEAPLTGRFNAGNLLAALAVLCLLGVPFDEACERLARVRGVAGRMECFSAPGKPAVIVDYSHTPDALEKALAALRPLTRGRLVCVVGCGGDRDRGKRPDMGRIAETLGDRVVVTSDNPRNEAPEAIIADILAGMTRRVPVQVEPDRAAAVKLALAGAAADDVVLVAGKGHETWQEIAGRRLPFSDRQLVRTLLGGSA
jgi:UDP-N-acetylmuramoyl-L-alanyl-D-glutamate--2,6-diaminopimelate ligase